ncbi:AMP-binding protein [Nocardia sp. NBC_00508]|uniref:AMP-binding protein n=1 Tax=Nocardia sp. NBC_00508 TaxID=2975992 RepID=UPI002E8112B3|nr:AMP-binding protein [Nocardia sp. NBC_00508]WUD66562.1 AMP-binding protein [Nocardia sp. NBC_00508]
MITEAVRGIWARELGFTDFSDEDDFFVLGGDSLTMARIQEAFIDHFDIEVPMDELFRRATVESISDHLTSLHPYPQVNYGLAETLRNTDEQFASSAPSAEVRAAAGDPDLSAAQMIETYLRGYADRPALGHRRSGSFDVITYRQFHSSINCLRARWSAPSGGGLRAGDFVATLGFTSADYAVVDLACTLSGFVTVPLHNTFDAHQIVPILRETAPRVLAVSVESLPVAIEALAGNSTVERVVVFDYVPEDDGHRAALARARTRLGAVRPELTLTSLPDEIAAGNDHAPPPPVYVPDGEDTLATIIYTSGSTGTPKGAMFPTSWIKHYWRRSVGRPDPSVPALHLQNLPLSFLGGRQWLASTLSNGGTGYFTAGSDNSTFLEDLALVRPTELVMVPKLCGEIFRLFQNEQSRLRELGIEQAAATESAMRTIRVDVLGGRVVTACCGGAPLSATIRDFVQECLGIQVVDGYGSTEAGTTVTENGRILPAVVDYKLVDVLDSGYTTADRPHPRGELYIKSVCAFSGYYRRPEDTAEVFDADGFYKTGDIMAEVSPGRLTYIDRASNILKLAAVGFVSVSKLEAIYSGAPELRQIYIYGNSAQPFLLAVVVPNRDFVEPGNCKNEISAALRRVAADNALAFYEIPRDFLVEPQDFTRTNGLLSSSGKLLRPALKEQYGKRLESLYSEL